MFSIIRTTIFISLFVLTIIIYNLKKTRKKRYIVTMIVIIIIYIASMFIPFENLICNFSSAEDAYKYYIFGEPDINLVLEGDSTSLVVGELSDKTNILIIPKDKKDINKWEIGIGIDTREVYNYFANNIVVSVQHYRKSNDFYVILYDVNGLPCQISNSFDVKFTPYEKYSKELNKQFITYYAYIPNFDIDFIIDVNGNEILFR